jgi:hydrogenase expression/formation protein HypE
MASTSEFSLSCPIPITDHLQVLMGHGGGGRLMHELIEKMLLPAFNNRWLDARHDSAVIELSGLRLAFTTDSFVVHPLFFPGGDIGSLAVHGTVNDLAMAGARPMFLSAAFILEEGLSMETLWQVVQSMGRAAEACGVRLATGDTKVVDRGKGDGIFINTTGIGLLDHGLTIEPRSVQPGDAVVLNGDIGRHGTAIMTAREGLAFESSIESDSAPVAALVQGLIAAGIEVHCLRDLTRGGLASALVEIAEASKLHIEIEERSVPVRRDVRGACEVLGLDPFYVANEGRFVAFVPAPSAEQALDVLRSHPLGAGASIIGEARTELAGQVTVRTAIGGRRFMDLLSGEQLPRIC